MDSLSRRLQMLEEGLDALPPAADAMSLGELDGFIAGLLVCPVAIEPEEWLSMLWRDREEDGVTPIDMGAADGLLHEILDHHRRTSLELKASEEGYRPIFYASDETGETIWQPWAAGFGEAMQLRMESWSIIERGEDAEAANALGGIATLIQSAHEDLAAEDGTPAAALDPDLAELMAGAADMIPFWVETLFDWRLAFRPDPVQAPIRVVKIGRNDPCPCGSGKKYKKCCGAAQAA